MKTFLTSILFLFCFLPYVGVGGGSASAQKLTVESFTLAQNDISAQVHERKDLNGVNCALVKVGLGLTGCQFEGGVMGTVENKTGEYWVYMPKGNRCLKIKHQNYAPIMVTFADYGIEKLESNRTYAMTVVASGTVPQSVDAGGNFYVLSVSPKNAMVTIDNVLQPTSTDGEYMAMLPYGTHTYKVEAGGYISKSGTFTITNSDMSPINVTLVSALATVNISCPTPAVSLYVDKKSVGNAPWSGNLKEGMHLIEAKKDGYRSQQKTINLSQQQKLDVTIDALIAMKGNLSVSYKPIGADIYIDGEKLGQSPRVFNGILVGNHKVEVKKEGYTSESKTVSVAEGQTATISGSLSQSVSTPTSSPTSSVSGTQTFTVNGVKFEMVNVQGGTFTMGGTSEQGSDAESDERPTHQVTLSNYSIGKCEVTQALWQAVMGQTVTQIADANGWKTYGVGDNYPMYDISWNDCQTFISKLNSLTGKRFRFPTEAEWEYAARGGNKSKGYKYSGSNNLVDVAWYTDNSNSQTHPVGTKQPNELGIYDMSGNVWEWCQDRYGNYSSRAQTNPTGPTSGAYRVFRGGGWSNYARYCRSSSRGDCTPDYRSNGLGLRLCLSE